MSARNEAPAMNSNEELIEEEPAEPRQEQRMDIEQLRQLIISLHTQLKKLQSLSWNQEHELAEQRRKMLRQILVIGRWPDKFIEQLDALSSRAYRLNREMPRRAQRTPQQPTEMPQRQRQQQQEFFSQQGGVFQQQGEVLRNQHIVQGSNETHQLTEQEIEMTLLLGEMSRSLYQLIVELREHNRIRWSIGAQWFSDGKWRTLATNSTEEPNGDEPLGGTPEQPPSRKGLRYRLTATLLELLEHSQHHRLELCRLRRKFYQEIGDKLSRTRSDLFQKNDETCRQDRELLRRLQELPKQFQEMHLTQRYQQRESLRERENMLQQQNGMIEQEEEHLKQTHDFLQQQNVLLQRYETQHDLEIMQLLYDMVQRLNRHGMQLHEQGQILRNLQHQWLSPGQS